MAKPIRNDTHEGWFHVTNLGARKYDVFIDDDDRFAFVDLLARHTSKRGIEVAAYCLMATHFHLVLHCPEGNMSSTMQILGSQYTRIFNRSHGFTGSLFEKRFFSKPVLTDDYLVTLTRYIHRNPLEAGLDITAYPWSSYPKFVGIPEGSTPLQIVSDLPLELAGGSDRYRQFVEADLLSDEARYSNGTRLLPPTGRRRTSPTLREIDEAVASAGELAMYGAARTESLRRQLAVLLAVDSGAFSLTEIAVHHGFQSDKSVRSALRAVRPKSEVDSNLSALLTRARDLLRPLQPLWRSESAA